MTRLLLIVMLLIMAWTAGPVLAQANPAPGEPEQTEPADPPDPPDVVADEPDAPDDEPAEPTPPTPPPNPDIARIAQLSDPDFAVREAAYFDLLGETEVDEARLMYWMRLANSLEARHRVLNAAQHHVLKNSIRKVYADSRQASVGLTQQAVRAQDAPDLQRAAVLVVMTFPGFPAYAQLKPGDMIVRFAGEDMPDDLAVDTFRDMVQQHENGDEVELTVIRQGKPLDLKFQLGSFEALSRMYEHNERALEPPFREQWAKVRAKLLKVAPPMPREKIK